MKVETVKRAAKDLEKFREEVKDVIKAEIKRLKEAPTLASMGNVEKMKGYNNRKIFKLKKDDFRFVMEKEWKWNEEKEIEEEQMTILVIADRKDSYKKKKKL
jgi:mRNA-degrading endonuclease RelE of RelBE toxin-antitoxin system